MICIYHSKDLDGWMSAAIVKHKYPDAKLIGWDYGQPYPEIPDRKIVIMVDIAFKSEVMHEIYLNHNTIWIDHHARTIKDTETYLYDHGLTTISGRRDPLFAACELAWQYFFPDKEMPEIVRLLGRYDCFGHKNTSEEQDVLNFQYAARAYWTSWLDCYNALINPAITRIPSLFKEIGKGIYTYLCTEAKQIYATKFDVNFDGFKFACINAERFNPINFKIDYQKDGYDGVASFHYHYGNFTYSLYSHNENVDCSAICAKRGGGGHKGAAGFQTKNIILS